MLGLYARWLTLTLGAACCAVATARAESIAVPNASFELPKTELAFPAIDNWQKSPKPDWYDESGGFTWDQLAGVFLNQAPTNSAYIDNADGEQGLYLFAVPQVAVFQDYNSTDWMHTEPLHDFDARFEPGNTYELTVGIIGGGGAMASGVTMQMALYYRDASSNVVIVAGASITNTPAAFPTTTHYIDQTVRTPLVTNSDAWAGQPIGILFASTVSPELSGGYWDLDDVRLTSTPAGLSFEPRWANGRFSLVIHSEPGAKLEVRSSSDIAAPLSTWSSAATLTNTTGVVTYEEADDSRPHRFYTVVQLL